MSEDGKDGSKPHMFEKRKLSDRRTNLFVNGVECTQVPFDIAPDQHIRDIRAMKIRDDDIFIAAYPKCGTHWTWEIVQMLINKTTAHEARVKEHAMLEFCPVALFDEQQSPRILNSHLYFAHLPEELPAKKTKILHLVRNPKDALVSMFHHFSAFLDITWPELIEEILSKAGNLKDQFSFLRQMDSFQTEHPDHPLLLVYYEDLKKNPTKVIAEIADFLCVPASEEFYQDVADACGFDQLKQFNLKKNIPEHLKKMMAPEKNRMYRKGIIGDWKNQFTVAQNERVDAFIQQEMKDLPFTFTYN